MTYVIGLTGGIGCGKTLVSDRFAKFNVPVIDTDIIAREIVAPGEATLTSLVNQFGAGILQSDGQLDRTQLRTIAFSNASNKKALDEITHPAIRQKTLNQINAVTAPYCLVVVPLLSESSPFISVMQRVLVVTANQKTKIERIKTRSQLSEEEIKRIMSTQLDDSERLNFADDVINNDQSIEQAYSQVESLHTQYLDIAATFNTINR